MKQTAQVKEVVGDKALLLVKRQSMCDGCHRESGCGGCAQILEVEVENTLHASVGDTVEIETPGGTVIAVAALVFLLPLLLAFAAYGIASILKAGETVPYLAALLTTVFCYAAIAFFVRKSKKTLKIVMTKILDETAFS